VEVQRINSLEHVDVPLHIVVPTRSSTLLDEFSDNIRRDMKKVTKLVLVACSEVQRPESSRVVEIKRLQ